MQQIDDRDPEFFEGDNLTEQMNDELIKFKEMTTEERNESVFREFYQNLNELEKAKTKK